MSGRGRLGKGLLGGEALGIGAGAGEGAARRLGALHLCDDALFKTLAETVEGRLAALDIAEFGTKAEDHDRPVGSSLRVAAVHAAISCHRPSLFPLSLLFSFPLPLSFSLFVSSFFFFIFFLSFFFSFFLF